MTPEQHKQFSDAKTALVKQAEDLLKPAKEAKRDLSAEEKATFNRITEQFTEIERQRLEAIEESATPDLAAAQKSLRDMKASV